MNARESQTIVRMIYAQWPSFSLNEDLESSWYAALCQYDFQEASKAAIELIKCHRNNFPPSVGALVGIIQEDSMASHVATENTLSPQADGIERYTITVKEKDKLGREKDVTRTYCRASGNDIEAQAQYYSRKGIVPCFFERGGKIRLEWKNKKGCVRRNGVIEFKGARLEDWRPLYPD